MRGPVVSLSGSSKVDAEGRTYERSRKRVLLLRIVDDLKRQLNQGARVHVGENDIAKSRVNERFEMAFLGTWRWLLESGSNSDKNEGDSLPTPTEGRTLTSRAAC